MVEATVGLSLAVIGNTVQVKTRVTRTTVPRQASRVRTIVKIQTDECSLIAVLAISEYADLAQLACETL
jgi:hypothetical protein